MLLIRQNGQSFLLSVRQPAQNSEQTKIKDAQKHFGSVLGYELKSKKISKLFSTNFDKRELRNSS
jgi:hypothetical protein